MVIKEFKPKKFASGKHIQTIYNVLFPPKISLRKNYYCENILLSTSDADQDILWLEHNPPKEAYQKKEVSYNGHYLILIHGLEGNSESHYIVSLAELGLQTGYGIIRVNLRNCGQGLGFAKSSYHSGRTEDIHDIIKYVYKNISKKIILCGFSLSGNMILKYLGEKKRKEVRYFSAVSPPINLKKTCEYIDSKKFNLYKTRFLKSLLYKIQNGYYELPPDLIKKSYHIQTFFDFDDLLTAPSFGYKSALDFYEKNSCFTFIPNINQQGILIHAKDDPIVPPSEIDKIDWKKLPNIKIVLTEKGGHIGFTSEKSPEIPDGNWLSRTLIDYFDYLQKENK